MITTYIHNEGGFGNKLFQIAASLSLAKDNNDEIILPEWDYKNFFKNKIKTDDIVYSLKWDIWKEPGHNFFPIKYTENLRLDGYFQSEKYFKDNSELIKYYFTPSEEIENYIQNKYGKLLEDETVSIHVRRGDYLWANNRGLFYILDQNYFYNALKYFDKNIKILCFSDDIKWCKENFKMENIFFIENEKNYVDLFLMSKCKNNIISNSTFSWWGAWLNQNENKKIISPNKDKWFGEGWKYHPWGIHNVDDKVPEEWIKI